jgi:Flp pilus assembly pilin Flp
MYPVVLRRSCSNRGPRRGQTLVEYALILAIISILAIAMLLQLSSNTRQIYSNINSQLSRGNVGS